MATIRELFHSLGNKHNLVTVGSSSIKEVIEERLEDTSLPEETKKVLSEAVKDLGQVIQDALEADKVAREIHDRVYEVLNPDTGKPK